MAVALKTTVAPGDTVTPAGAFVITGATGGFVVTVIVAVASIEFFDPSYAANVNESDPANPESGK